MSHADAPLPAASQRQKMHTRTIVIEGYRCSDGLWDIEGEIKGGGRAQVARIVGDAKACTHLTELIGNLATAAVQTTAGKPPEDLERALQQLGGCFAYRESGELVREYFPRWYRTPPSDGKVCIQGNRLREREP